MTRRRAVLVTLAVVVLVLQSRIWFGEGSLAHVDALSDRVERGLAANESKVQRNKILRAEIIDLKSGLASIEEKARSELGLIKKGETFVLLVEAPSEDKPQ